MHIIERGAERFGHRGVLLILVGIMWVGIGIGIEFNPAQRPEGVLVLHELLPDWLRAGAWGLSGLWAIVVGLRGRRADDTTAYVAIMLMPLERLVSFALSWVIYVATLGLNHFGLLDIDVTGYNRGWYSALVWLIVVVLLQVVAGWRNPAPAYLMPLPESTDQDAE